MGCDEVLVWMVRYADYELVGAIRNRDVGLSFAYDKNYRGPAISKSMPIDKAPATPHRTQTFFHALAPEGDTQLDFLNLMRAGRSEWLPFLKKLGDESSGALVFTVSGKTPCGNEGYEPLAKEYFEQLASDPAGTTIGTL